MRDEPAAVGRTYADALFAYEDCATIGLVHDGAVVLNPPPRHADRRRATR